MLICVHGTVRFNAQKAHDCLVGRIAADNSAMLVIHGSGVHADCEFQLFMKDGVLLRHNHRAIRREEVHDLKPPARDRPRLVTEEDVQRAGGLDAHGTPDEDAARKHAARILHEDE